jgi:hypothetical protein
VGSRVSKNKHFRSIGTTTLWQRIVCYHLHQKVDGINTWMEKHIAIDIDLIVHIIRLSS